MSAGGNRPTIHNAGRVEPIAAGRSDAARLIESLGEYETVELFTLAPFSDPDTSRAAAKAIVPHIERLERSVLVALMARPMSAQELEVATGLSGNTVRPRLVTLRGKGLVEQVLGTYAVTTSGRSARVYRLTEKGKEAIK